MNKKVLGILCALAIISSCVIYGAGTTGTNTDTGTATQESTDQAKAQETYQANADDDGNIAASMNIVSEEKEDTPYYAKKQDENFRGNQPVDGEDATIHYIEDNPYSMHENSLTYRKSGEEVASGTQLTESPNINWTIEKEGGDGSSGSSDNNNSASKDCTFADAGTYSVHNSGSRQLTEADGIGGTDEEMASGTQKTDGGKKEEKEPKFMTAEGRIPVKVHDVTPPDVWIAFQENDVDIDKLSETLQGKIREKEGVPLDNDDSDDLYAKTSFIFVDEGQLYPKPEGYDEMTEEEKNEVKKDIQEKTAIYGRRDQEYPYKSVRVTLSGSIFNAEGNYKANQYPSIVHTIESDRENLNREANCDFVSEVKRVEDKKEMDDVANESLLDKQGKNKYAVYARRNVPLLPLVMGCDNGNKRATAAPVPVKTDKDEALSEKNSDGDAPEEDENALSKGFYRIYSSNKPDATDGQEVEQQSDGSYLFRVANYPKDNYKDQPYYFFETEVKDSAQNSTKVRIPIYVVNTSANFEGNSK